MKNKNLAFIIGIIAGVLAVAGTVSAFMLIKEKKRKDDEELERYLDCAIQ